MKRHTGKRLLSSALVGALLLTGLVLPASAAETNGETVAAEPETVSVSSGLTARDNSFNEGWKFYLGNNSSAQNPGFDDSSWKSVTLPHDFSISQSFTTSGEAESGFLPGGTGWYRKTFTLPESCAACCRSPASGPSPLRWIPRWPPTSTLALCFPSSAGGSPATILSPPATCWLTWSNSFPFSEALLCRKNVRKVP